MNSGAAKTLKAKRIGVLAGGWSSEREVSLKTGEAALGALIASGYDAVCIDAGKNLPQQLLESGIEVALVALHGQGGEDGQVQGLLEVMQIPYTGSGVRASSVAMDKIVTKELLQYHRLPTPAFDYLRPGEAEQDLIGRCQQIPVVVKPSCEGSTLGVTVVKQQDQLQAAVAAAGLLNGAVMLEEYIDGAEMTVSVVNDQALPIIQIVPEGGFYDYRAKYQSNTTQYLVPAPISEVLAQQIQQVALSACRLLGCRGAARVDFMVRDDEFFCIEVNTIPGMTATSLLPKAARSAGISFEQLIEMILLDAGLGK